MSNLRVNTIVPDPKFNPTNVVNLPGDFRIAGKFTASAVTVTETLNLGNILKVGEGISFTNVSLGGLLPFVKPASDSSGVLLSGGSDSLLASRIALYGNQWPVAADAGSLAITAPGKVSLSAGNGAASMQFSPNGKASFIGDALSVPSGRIDIGNATDVTSTTDRAGAAYIAGGLALGMTLRVGLSTVTPKLEVTGTASQSIVTAGGIVATGDVTTSARLYTTSGITVASTGSASGDVRILGTGDKSVWSDGGAVLGKGLTTGGAIYANGPLSTTGLFRSTDLTEADASGTAAGVFLGGLHVGKSLRVAGDTTCASKITGAIGEMTSAFIVSNEDDTLALGTGSAIIRSGISVAKRAWFGSSINAVGSGSFASVSATGAINGAAVSCTSLTVQTGGIASQGPFTGTTMSLTGVLDSSANTSAATISAPLGGMFIGKSVRIGENLRLVGTATFESSLALSADLTVSASGRLLLNNAEDVIINGTTGLPTAAALQVSGGAFIAKTLFVAGQLQIGPSGARVVGEVAAGSFRSVGDQDTNGLLSGAIYTPGGMAISKKLIVGGAASFLSSMSVSAPLMVTDASQSGSSVTGSIVTRGGIGAGGNIYAAGSINATTMDILGQSVTHGVAYFTSVAETDDTSTGSIVCLGGVAVQLSARIGGKLYVTKRSELRGGIDVYESFRGYDTAQSDSLITGAMVLAGGFACAGNINSGGALSVMGSSTFLGKARFTHLDDSSTPSDGGTVFVGGVGIGRNLNVGGALSIGAMLSVSGTITNMNGSLQLNSVSIQDFTGIVTVKSAAPGLRIAGTTAVATVPYGNSLDLFTLGSAYTDSNTEAFQIASSGTTGFSLMTRATGTGNARRIVLQAGAANTGQLTLNTDGTLTLGSSGADVSRPALSGTASVRVSGGLSVQGGVALGGRLGLYPSSSSSIGITLRAPSNSVGYDLVMPSGLPTKSNFALVSDTSGTLSWAEMTTANPSFNTVNITGTTVSDAPSRGALLVAGGIGTLDNVSIGKLLRLYSNNTNDVSFSASPGSSKYALTLPPSLPTADNYALTSSVTGTLSWKEMTTKNPTFETVTVTGQGTYGTPGIVFRDSTLSGGVRLKAPETVMSSSPIAFTLPRELPTTLEPEMMVCDANGNLGFFDRPYIFSETRSFVAKNNVISPEPISGLTFTGMFRVEMNVVMSTSGGFKSALFTLKGYTTGLGYSLYSSSVGSDDIGVSFTIDQTSGQVMYMAANTPGWIETIFRWEETTIRGSHNTQSVIEGSNDVTDASIPGLVAQGEYFNKQVLVVVATTTGVQRSLYSLSGTIQSDGRWYLSQHAMGPDLGITFVVLPSGQIQYSSTYKANWLRTTFQIDLPPQVVQSDAKFTNLQVLGTAADSFKVQGGVAIEGDLSLNLGNLSLAKGDLLPNIVDRIGSVTDEVLSGFASIHRYMYSGTAVNVLPLTTRLVEGAIYEVSFTLSGQQAVDTSLPSYVRLHPNGSTAYGNVFPSAFTSIVNGVPAYTRITSNAFQFTHATVSNNPSGHALSGTWRIYNVLTDKSVNYSGGNDSGYANGTSWWNDTATVWSIMGSLTASASYTKWCVWIKRIA